MPKQTKVKPRQAKARQIKWRQARTSRQMKINTSGICIVRNYNEHLSNWVRGWTKGRCFSYSKGNLYIQLKIKILFDIFTKLRSASNNTRYNSNLAPKLGEYNKRNKLFISLGEMSIIFRDNIAIGLLRCSWNYWPIYWLVFHRKSCRIFAETTFDLHDYYFKWQEVVNSISLSSVVPISFQSQCYGWKQIDVRWFKKLGPEPGKKYFCLYKYYCCLITI